MDVYHEESFEDAANPKQLDVIDAAYLNTAGLSSTQIQEVRSAALAAALKESPLNPRSAASRKLYFAAFVAFLCACCNGYDGSLFSGISPMYQYRNHFQVDIVGQDVALIFSMYNAGSMIGALFAGPIADIMGRRKGMFIGGILIVTGAIIVTTANVIKQLVGGRFVLGFGVAIMTVSAPAYVTEIAPAHWRGRMVGVYNNGWNGGSIPAAAICYGCSFIQSNAAWRIPMALQGSYSGLVLVLVWFIPESPRWLMSKGRDEEALEFLTKYHGNGDPNSALVRLEMAEMREALVGDKRSDERWYDYRDLFVTSNARYRMLSVLLISIFGQFSGNGLGYFQNVIYENLGYTSPQTQLALNLGGSFLGAVCGFTGAAFSDRLPRVKTLTFGTFGLACCLAVNGALSEAIAQQPVDANGDIINPNNSLGQGALFANYMFSVVYSFTYTPLQGVYPSENLTNTTRAKGLGASGIIVSLFGFINTYAGPIALEKMKNRYIFVFVGWDLVETAIWWFCGVETQGKTIEELDEVYSQKYPPFASRKKTKIAVTEDNRVVEIRDA